MAETKASTSLSSGTPSVNGHHVEARGLGRRRALEQGNLGEQQREVGVVA
jgi:hypothetical protein